MLHEKMDKHWLAEQRPISGGSKLIEQTLPTTVTSSAETLLVENINSSSLLEIQDNTSISGSAFKNLTE